MEDKKSNFFVNIADKWSTVEPDRKKFIIIVGIILLALIIISIITSIIVAKTVGDAGKVAGNLNNEGFAVQKGNSTYITNSLINPEVSGLYEVTKNNTTRKIEESEYIKSINYTGGYLYFLEINKNQDSKYTKQIVKMKPDGSNRQVLVGDIETVTPGNYSLKVSGGWVYYINGENKLEAIKTNGKNRKQISDEEVARFQIVGKYVYFSTRDSDFKRMKKDGSSIEKINTGIDTFQIVGDYVYYISKANHYLVKLNISTNEKEENAIEKYVRTFNIVGKTIYYVTQNEKNEVAIYKVKTNGKKDEKIVDLQSVNVYINVVGDYIYYTDNTEDSIYYYSIYRIKTNGKDKEKVNI